MNKQVKQLTYGAMIAAIYVVLTLFINAFNLANGAIQVRISEALTILPAFTSAAVPGLFVGCIISNVVTGCALPDIIFGSLATLMAAFFTNRISYKYWTYEGGSKVIRKFLTPLPPIISNTVIIPFVLKYAYGIEGTILFLAVTICIGEILSCGVLGLIFMTLTEKRLIKIMTTESKEE